MSRGRTLPRSFYARDALELAPDLLNKLLVHDDRRRRAAARRASSRSRPTSGPTTPGSHAFRGMTPRIEMMFGPPGHLYVYFTYGMHWCANVVATKHGDAAAVLLRAAAPVDGIEVMRARRAKARRDRDLLAGPGPPDARRSGSPAPTTAPTSSRGPIRIVDDGVAAARRARRVASASGSAPGRGDEHPWRFYRARRPAISVAGPPRRSPG